MVQNKNARQIWQDISAGGYIYVCGSTSMGSNVTHALETIFRQNGLSQEEAESKIAALHSSGRYIQELWN